VRAFAQVESGKAGAYAFPGLPVIAYEGHRFRRNTGGKYDKQFPDLSYKYVEKAGPEWKRNNADQKTAWLTLKSAAAIDAEVAMTSCSWGRFQIMGDNYKVCGYKNVVDFVEDMKASEAAQMRSFIAFCKSRKGFAKAMKDKEYKTLAISYNGPYYGDYDKRIEKAYKKLSSAK
jgi:hypothetical protein